MSSTIFPTHKCFDDALDLLCEILKRHPDAAETDEFRLVHAIVAPGGEEFAHAWVETDHGRGVALWFGIKEGKRQMFAVRVDEYRRDFKVVEALTYTPREAWEQNAKHGYYGPWTERHLALCGRDRRLMAAL